ncbi:alpha/beta fold hydrolase [Microcoleus sp. N3A4]|uniref:alpha/beta fold hydrolase n=1 Tax=Microcoleus sp. N3A4 TaxID=3055379 RepID=UPI002FD2E377
MLPYQAPWYLKNGSIMTVATDLWYGTTWRWWGDRVTWLRYLPKVPWQEHIFTGAEGVPLWGLWSCPTHAKGTIILNLGITAQVKNAWYAHIFARKAYNAGFAVLLYDWRGHGRTAELSPVPSSYGWREGEDQVNMAAQLVAMGCPDRVALVGFSIGGQLALWGLKAAIEQDCPFICGAAALSCHLESTRSLAHLRSTTVGRIIEQHFVKNLCAEAEKRRQLFPYTVKPGAVERIKSIDSFDREIAIDYYGFTSVAEYYQKTSAIYFLDKLTLPYLIVYSQDDPMFDPKLIAEVEQLTDGNPNAHFILTQFGGHTAHVGVNTGSEDNFWGMNRLLEFCERLLDRALSASIIY